MNVIADASIIIRSLFTADAPEQSQEVADFLEKADTIVVPMVALCEAVAVLEKNYQLSKQHIAKMLRLTLQISSVVTDADAVLAGIRMLEDGGDFEDGVIQYTGAQKATKAVFVSLDSCAVRRLSRQGIATAIPCPL